MYCDMETDGGWTVIGHYRHPTTQNAPADLAFRDYAYFMKSRTNATYGRAEYIANPNSEAPGRTSALGRLRIFPIEFAVVLEAVLHNWDNYNAKVIYRVKNRNILPNYGTSQPIAAGDNLLFKLNPADNWQDVRSNSASRHYYWYPRNQANQYLSLFHVSNYAYLDGRAASNYHHANYYGAGIPVVIIHGTTARACSFASLEGTCGGPTPSYDPGRWCEAMVGWKYSENMQEYLDAPDDAYVGDMVSGVYRLDTPSEKSMPTAT